MHYFKLVKNLFACHNIKCMQKNGIILLLYRQNPDVISISSIVCVWDRDTDRNKGRDGDLRGGVGPKYEKKVQYILRLTIISLVDYSSCFQTIKSLIFWWNFWWVLQNRLLKIYNIMGHILSRFVVSYLLVFGILFHFLTHYYLKKIPSKIL